MTAYVANRPMLLEDPVTAPDGAGGYALSWQALGTIWAELRPGSASEGASAFGPEGRMRLRLYTRAAPQGSPRRPRADQRLRDGDRLFRILSVSEADAQGAWLLCHVVEEVPS